MSDPQTLAGGRYLLVERLGEGGMATVWRAFDQRLQVWRAVKVLLPEYSRKKKIMARFEAEAQTMALLEHPHIVRVYDVDRDGEHAYIVMELVEGGSLVDWLERHGPMPARMAVDVIVEVCQALEVAHGKGVIHRDIKPHNIMVDRDGTCRLTDFGIARAGDTDAHLTKTGAVMGTWGFMAPEQRTDAKHVDARADVYALAATLYALLTDKTPLELFAADRDPSMLEGVPEALVPVLVRATEYRPEKRHGTAAELAVALLEVREALPEPPPGTPSLRRDLEPLPPPPARPAAPAAGPVSRGGAETMIPDEADISGTFTAPPQDDGPAADPVSQPRPVWTPPAEPAPPRAVQGDGGRRRPGVLVGVAVGLALALGAGVLASRPAPGPAPSPVVTLPAAEAPVEAVASAEVAAEGVPSRAAAAVADAPSTSGGAGSSGGAASRSTPATPPPTAARDEVPPAPPPAPAAPAREAPTPEAAPPAPPPSAPPAPARRDPGPTPAPSPTQAPAGSAEAPAAQCFQRVDLIPPMPTPRAPLGFRAYTCKKQDAKVTLFYRPVDSGSTWFAAEMPFMLGASAYSLRLDGELAGGVEWYLESEGVTWGSASGPKVSRVAAD